MVFNSKNDGKPLLISSYSFNSCSNFVIFTPDIQPLTQERFSPKSELKSNMKFLLGGLAYTGSGCDRKTHTLKGGAIQTLAKPCPLGYSLPTPATR